MRLCTIRVLSVCLSTSVALVSVGVAQQSQEPVNDNAGHIRALQKERVEILRQLVEACVTRYEMGGVEFSRIVDAQDALVKAQLELTDKPEERIALLEKQLKASERLLDITEKKSKIGFGGQEDLLRAKARCLDVRIRLLQERSRRAPPTDPAEE